MTFATIRAAMPYILSALALSAAANGRSMATTINTANEAGAYHKDFCPRLEKSLAAAKLYFKCTPSDGSIENIARVLDDPKQIGFSQFDIYARETAKRGGSPLTLIRDDIGRECLFMVTRNKTFKTYGDIASLAPYLRFVLPPQGSGSAATFEYLQKMDPDGLGKAENISYTASADAAIGEALSSEDDAVTLFVQFPDPNNARFRLIDEKEGQFIPVIDRSILRQEISGQKIYYAEETEISNPKFLKKGETVVTSCTPVTLFTGAPERVSSGVDRANHQDMIRTVQALDRSVILPSEGFFASLLKRTKELSAAGVEEALLLSDKAREKSGLLLLKGQEKAGKIVEDSERLGKDAVEKARELKRRAQEKAKNRADREKKTR